MFTKVSVAALLAGAAAAYHAPVGEPKGNAITAPLLEVVPACKPYTIKWIADSPNPVSILLVKGPSSNVVFDQVIVEGIANSGSFVWTPPATLDATAGPGGYGLQLIDDKDGHFQWSAQFGISTKDCAEKPVSSSVAPVSSTKAPKPSETASGYAVSTASPVVPSSSAYEVPSSSAYVVPSVNSTSTCSTTTQYVAPPVGTGAPSAGAPSTIIYPTGPVTVPQSLKTSATGYPTSTPPAQFPGAASGLKAGLGLAGAVAGLVLML